MSVYLPPLASKDIKKLTQSVHQLPQGRTNANGTFTLAPNATSTTVSFSVASPTTGALLFWQPTTPNAAAQMATLYCLSTGVGQTKGQFVLQHASNTSTDQTFNFEVRG